jgi:hypothetical protein
MIKHLIAVFLPAQSGAAFAQSQAPASSHSAKTGF